MTALLYHPRRARFRPSARSPQTVRPWAIVVPSAAALAVSMGIGRFAYTPILPLMHARAGLSAQQGSALATANYLGYLAGAVLGIVCPRLLRSVVALPAGLVVVIVSVL